MAFYKQNITDSTATKITGASATLQFSRISVCNIEASAAATVDLYIEDISDSTSKTYILNNTVIPNGATLVLVREDLQYAYDEYDLYILSTGGQDISIIVN